VPLAVILSDKKVSDLVEIEEMVLLVANPIFRYLFLMKFPLK
jgi:hypothetical protein